MRTGLTCALEAPPGTSRILLTLDAEMPAFAKRAVRAKPVCGGMPGNADAGGRCAARRLTDLVDREEYRQLLW